MERIMSDDMIFRVLRYYLKYFIYKFFKKYKRSVEKHKIFHKNYLKNKKNFYHFLLHIFWNYKLPQNQVSSRITPIDVLVYASTHKFNGIGKYRIFVILFQQGMEFIDPTLIRTSDLVYVWVIQMNCSQRCVNNKKSLL